MQQNSFIDILFPTDASSGTVGGPEFFTNITTSKGCSEFRNANWEKPKRKYVISYKNQSNEQIENLVAFFNICQGRQKSFRYKDWSDYRASNTLISSGDGKQKEFQMQKQYIFKDTSSTRTITKPVPNTVEVFINSQKIQDQMFQVDYLNGLLKFINPPKENEVITSSFEFHVPTRFDTDFLPIQIIGQNRYLVENIILTEVNL